MYAIKAIYDGTNFMPKQPIPVNEKYEVIITFVEPVIKKQTRILEFFNSRNSDELLDLEDILEDKGNVNKET